MRTMFVTSVFLASTLVSFAESATKQRDYVPDEKTAMKIAEAVLVARYGEETVKAQLPLLSDHNQTNRDYWIIELRGPVETTGGGPAVWINRHSGCLRMMEHMK